MDSVRVRFAPSPTGMMHLGNVRAALINFLFAKQKNGTFILRLEDTDQQRNVDPNGAKIIQDIHWLKLFYQEGPDIGGPYSPYMQSQRADIYKEHLRVLEHKRLIYRCFCSTELLEKKRKRQLSLKLPPKYDRACLNLSSSEIEKNLQDKVPFIWRFKLQYDHKVSFFDLGHKNMEFDLSNFSDFALTRQDDSFTFMFANFVDDKTMKISHIFRGEDHLTNTAGQVALYEAFEVQIPIFWHLPIICNLDGKKLSKRDFGFSLDDLKNDGYLPEAICNYLAIIGHSYSKEIMDMSQLVENINFDKIASTSKIHYDPEKLRWINHNWIKLCSVQDIAQRCRPFLENSIPQIKNMPDERLADILKYVYQEFVTLKDSINALKFCVERPVIQADSFANYDFEKFKAILQKILELTSLVEPTPEFIITSMQSLCKEQKLSIKDLFGIVRISLIGVPNGPSVKDLISMIGIQESLERIKLVLNKN